MDVTGDRHPTQAEAAAHLDLSERSVRELEDKLGLPADYSLDHLRVAYIRHLREIAAGRSSATGQALDLAAERAALAREQRIGQAMKNAVARGDYAPIGLLADVLSAAASGVVDRFDQLDGALKKACPELPDDARQALHKVIASARNEWVRATASLVAARLDETTEEGDGSDDLYSDDEAAAE